MFRRMWGWNLESAKLGKRNQNEFLKCTELLVREMEEGSTCGKRKWKAGGPARRRDCSHSACCSRDINVSPYAGVLNMDFRRNGETQLILQLPLLYEVISESQQTPDTLAMQASARQSKPKPVWMQYDSLTSRNVIKSSPRAALAFCIISALQATILAFNSGFSIHPQSSMAIGWMDVRVAE